MQEYVRARVHRELHEANERVDLHVMHSTVVQRSTCPYGTAMKCIDITHNLSLFSDHWSPRIIAELNGQQVKLAKFSGAFDWHSHTDADEMFLVLHGSFTMEFRDHSVELTEGQMLVVPHGVEHRPVAETECSVMLVEPAGLVNTGDSTETERSTCGQWLTDR